MITRLRLLAVPLLAVLLAGCGWLQEGFNAGQTSSNDFERSVDVNNVASLVDQRAPGLSGRVLTTDDLLLVLDGTGLHAFDRSECPNAGQTACVPLWERPGVYQAASDGTSIFVAGPGLDVFALDLDGTPQWDATFDPADGQGVNRISVSDGYVFFVVRNTVHGGFTNQTMHVFAAAGCGQAHCTSLRTFHPGFDFGSEWAVEQGRLFLVSGANNQQFVVAYDVATGTELWRSGGAPAFRSMVARDGKLYVWGSAPQGVHVYDGSGSSCAGAPKTCAPQRVLFTPGIAEVVGATPNHVVAMDSFRLVAYWFANGTTGCTGSPLMCAPVVRTNEFTVPARDVGTVGLANGIVYISTGKRLLAYDEGGVKSCSGSPRVCTPFVTKTFANTIGAPVISDGKVYFSTVVALHALHLPG